MKNIIINLKTSTFMLNKDGKYIHLTDKIDKISNDKYQLLTSKDTSKFFIQIGGKEKFYKEYTIVGNVIAKIVSISPDNNNKTVRSFTFKSQ